MVLVAFLFLTSVLAQEPTAERRIAQGPGRNGTFFQPFINGINTFFNPSQFRNPLGTFRPTQPPRQQQQQQQQSFQQRPQQPFQPQQPFNFQQDFRQQQAGFQQQTTFQQQQQQQQQFQQPQQAVDPRDVPETFRGNLEAQPDFRITRFPQASEQPSQPQFQFVPGNQPAIRQQQASSSVGRVVRGSESETDAPPSFDWFDNLFGQIPKDTINVTETKFQ